MPAKDIFHGVVRSALAVPSEVYREFFLIQFIQEVIAEHRLKLLVFEPSQQEIILWKE
ncbi:MAG: element excision factor XisH family protein [Microcoleus sp.]